MPTQTTARRQPPTNTADLTRQPPTSIGVPDGRALVAGVFDLVETVLGVQRHLVDVLLARQRVVVLQFLDSAGPTRSLSKVPK